jgi:putative hydrolase of the HAD superfamily
VNTVAAELGGAVSDSDLAHIDADWDFDRRAVLLDPPPSTLETLHTLRSHGIRLGLLSNTHALELRTWDRSPLAPLFDVVGLSHEMGACKPVPAAYQHVLEALGVSASRTAYVGDGSSDELVGARDVGFGLVVLAEEAARRSAPDDLPRLREQADASVRTLHDLVPLVMT